jgi:hypothetical protein
MSKLSRRFTRCHVPAVLSLALLGACPAHGGRVVEGETAILPDELPLLAAADLPVPSGRAEPVAAPPRPDNPSQNVTINLIRRMVKKGLLGQDEADELISQAENDASIARAQASAMQTAIAQVQRETQQYIPDPALMATGEDTMRVTYIPDNVKAEMREQIKQEVMDSAKREHWASPKLVPDWSMHLRLFGDIRVRGQYDSFPDGNDNTGAFPNFNAINSGSPFDTSGTLFSPQLNVDRDRQRLRLRVRVGAEADLGNGFSAGLRIATGETNSPVTANQSLGVANQGQGGNFSKYAIWLDRGYLKYELGPGNPDKNLSLMLGRFDNPFFSTLTIWDEYVGFDGVAALGKYKLTTNLTPFATVGAFPVFNTDYNFSSNRPSKFKSTDKWLYAGQAGFDLKITKDLNLKLAVAYYHFDDVQGKLSDPFVPLTNSDQGNTDDTRPAFAQKGNTYYPIRRIIPTEANNFGTTNQFQYFGLVNKFQEFALTGRLDYTRWEPYKLTWTGEYVKNLGFDRAYANQYAVNNRSSDTALGGVGSFAGGDTAWFTELKFGSAALDRFGAWAIGANYRYIESDAVVDGFNDSDFGGGGTNLQGYGIYGVLGLSPRMSVGLRWLSANEIAGAPFKQDVFQIDFHGKF